ncbi:MAG TPA: GAF domain-containing protein [Gaiellaceae bacterium]|nr:GAF domain-containing protein [Gaiellaceae bacterium]
MQETEQMRLRALLDAGIAVSSELSLDAVLQRIVEAAASLTGARYAALGVIDSTRRELEQFVVTGLDDETKAAIGDLPRGRGILGVLIRDAAPLRLDDIASDARSVGFPPNHPPMKTFLGVPILLRGVAYGNLYLTEKEGGSFTDEDQEIVSLLAAQAAVAIENARLYESATRWLQQLESLAEVGNALATEIEVPRLLQLVASRLRDLIQARLVVIAMPNGDGALVVENVAGENAERYIGMTLGHPRSKSMKVLERRRSERVDSVIEDLEVDQAAAREFGAQTGLWVPLLTRDRAIGVIVAHDKLHADPRFTDEDVRIAEAFGERAAVAIDLSERVAGDALRRVVQGQELERKRLSRELHDETGQALTSILLGLRSIEEAVEDRPEVRESVLSLRELVVATLHDVRRLAVELRPKALDDFGLVPALERLAETFTEQTDIAVHVQSVLGDERLPDEIESALYRIVQEALTNVIKHAQASTVSIVLTKRGDGVAAVIEDDGRGFDPLEARDGGLGLVGMRERIALLGGRVAVESNGDVGTTVAVEVPLR